MNFKKTALVLAMAGIVAAPMAAQASAGDGAYASIRIGLQVVEKDGGEGVAGGTESTTIGGYASRFGFKGETDLGNGMTGFGEYQFSVNTDATAATIGNRLAYAGVKGDFGAISVGREYATFYDHVVGVNDNPWAGSGYAMVMYRGRRSNGLSYAGSAGAVSYGVTLQMDGAGTDTAGNQEVMDATELGLSYDAGFGKFGIALLDQKGPLGVDPESIMGLALSGVAAGPVTLGFGLQTQDVKVVGAPTRSTSSFLVDALFGNAYVHYETLDQDDSTNANADSTSLAIGYTKSFGPQTSAWFEYHDVDVDNAVGSVGDSTELRAIMKYDI
jgi:predicted porin